MLLGLSTGGERQGFLVPGAELPGDAGEVIYLAEGGSFLKVACIVLVSVQTNEDVGFGGVSAREEKKSEG